MLKFFFNSIITYFAFIFLLSGCDGISDLNPPGDSFAGTITFTDTNFSTDSGYYSISLYRDKSNPFDTLPLRNDSLTITSENGVYRAFYRMSGIQSGSYYVSSTWKRRTLNNDLPMLLGILGCDTNTSCLNYKKLLFPNFGGEYQNFLSHADTLKRMN